MFIYHTMAYHYYNVTTRTNYPPLILVSPVPNVNTFHKEGAPPYQKCSSVINDKVLLWSHPPPVPPHSKCKRRFWTNTFDLKFDQIHLSIWASTRSPAGAQETKFFHFVFNLYFYLLLVFLFVLFICICFCTLHLYLFLLPKTFWK